MSTSNPTKITKHINPMGPEEGVPKVRPQRPVQKPPVAISKNVIAFKTRFAGFAKRCVDIVVSTIAPVLFSPLILVISIVIKLQDGGPAFYSVVRVGRYGTPFLLYKFRTMVVGADKLGPGITAEGDTRVTHIGKWLRNTKLDELPQFLNVLRGQMSLVGPRPEDPHYVALYSINERVALDVRPGMTSAASTSYRYEQQMLAVSNSEDIYVHDVMPAKLAIDLAYQLRSTFGSDMGILMQTIAVLFERPNHSKQPIRSLLLSMRNRHFFVIDMLVMLILPSIALALRTDGTDMMSEHSRSLLIVSLIMPIIALLVFIKGGLYTKFWRYAGIDELSVIIYLGVLAVFLQTAFYVWVLRPTGLVDDGFPRSITLIDGLLMIVAVGAIRFSVRLADRPYHTRTHKPAEKRVVVAGAGTVGVMIVDELRRNPALGMKPVAFLDDDSSKWGSLIRGLTVMGKCDDIASVAVVVRADQVIIAMSKVPGNTIRRIVNLCEQAGIKAKIVPGIHELLGGTVSIKQVRDVKIDDLLRREPVVTGLAGIDELVRGKRVLVTGGGGSIGSEICRQVMRFEPSSLIILGHGENSVFEIHEELMRAFKAKAKAASVNGDGKSSTEAGLPVIESVIGDIRDSEHIRTIFGEYKPEVIFHAAAHKHVHLMEMNPREAITNNVLGTRNLLKWSVETGVEHFVMISTDKAVNPVGIMGATKRAAELLVNQAAVLSGKPYVAVRFGNVLGSRGSAVLTFQHQIAAGGPITITHPDMMRYFMTIPEAVQLVLQAATLGKGGEVFMLDMGEPVRILDLATDLIELSGLEVGRDIEIVCTGMRPGEKLVEELALDTETYKRTGHEKVFALSNSSDFVPLELDMIVSSLEDAAGCNDQGRLRALLQALVPEFQPKQGTAKTDPLPEKAQKLGTWSRL